VRRLLYAWALALNQAGRHAGKEGEVAERIYLEFLPSHSPELQLTESLWHLTNEAVANRLLESLEELEEVLIERCLALWEQAELIWSHTNYYWRPDAA
jgi:transposase